MKFVTRFEGYNKVGVSFDPEEKMTKDSFKSECDINNIIAKYKRTGQLPEMARQNPMYGDFASVPDFQDALDLVHLAKEQFDALPAALRKECFNDPAVFLERVQDKEWAIKHKLALPAASSGVGAGSPPSAGAEASAGSPKATKKPKVSSSDVPKKSTNTA